MKGELHFDVIVIGAGTAGLTAGARLAEGGAKVAVLAKGVGSTHLAPATIDVLSYAPDRVLEPGRALEELVTTRPDHPYALLGAKTVEAALQWFQSRVAAGPLPGYRYFGNLERNHLLPTPVGVLRPSTLLPETMIAGDAAAPDAAALGPVCIVGTRALRDFHASLCAANLRTAGVEARATEVPLALERADQSTLAMARRLSDPTWRASFCADLATRLRGGERVGMPAMLGLEDPHGVWSDVEHRLGRPVFEIPTLPPSVPGIRLFEILRAALRSAGGRLVLGAEVVAAQRDAARVTAVDAHASGHDRRYVADAFVLASGGFASGGIALDSEWTTRERLLGLPLRGLPERGAPRFLETYLLEQPLARVGVAVDAELRAGGSENVLVVGAALPGAASWREGSGEGIALTSGYRAAELVLSSERPTTEAAA